MRKKRLHIIVTILSLVVFCILAMLFMGCLVDYMIDPNLRDELDDLEAEKKGEREEAKKEEKQTEFEQEVSAEEPTEEVAEEAKKPIPGIPDKPVTYTGNIENGYPITATLIVNFKTKEVTGSLSCCGEGINTYVDATITDGKIELDTLEITTNYSGTVGSKPVEGSEGSEFPINGTITGKITDDLNTFNGEMSSEEGAQKFTATRK